MNYPQAIKEHIRTGAEITIATIPVERKCAQSFGILKVDEQGRIVDFFEKPKMTKQLILFRWMHLFDRHGVRAKPHPPCLNGYLYIQHGGAKRRTKETNKSDFGKDIIPEIIKKRRVFAYFLTVIGRILEL